ncbi:hypothetical protein ACUXK4_004530 [Methylorubrum extorquens]
MGTVTLILNAAGLAVGAAIGQPKDVLVEAGQTAYPYDAAAEAAGAWVGSTLRADGSWLRPGGIPADPSVADLRAYARARSYAIETSGVTVGGLAVSTERTSQGLIDRAVALLQADPTLTEVDFDGGDDLPRTLPAEQVRLVGIAVGRHVQRAFSARAAALRAIAAGTAVSFADVDAVLVGVMG